MQLQYNWSASFFDSTHSVVLSKPNRQMRVLLEYSADYPRLRVLDLKTRMPTTSYTHMIPEDVRAELLRVCAARWPRVPAESDS